MPPNKSYIELKIFDCEDPIEINDILGVVPTCTWKKGEEYIVADKKENIRKVRENNYWEYRSTMISTDWIGNQIEEFIIEILEPRKELIRTITERFPAEFSIVQYIYDSCNPGFYFDKKALQIFVECGLELNIDVYVLYQE